MVTDEHRAWNCSWRCQVLLFLAPFIGFAGMVAARFSGSRIWRWIDAEDGPIEWLQFVGLAVSAAYCLAMPFRLLPQRRKAAGVFLLAGLGMAFVAGEEIAWGQRLLGFQTPEALAEVNEKRETSLHNVDFMAEWFNLGKFAVGMYGTTGCWVLAGLARRRELASWEIFVVPWFLSSSFLVIFVQRVLRWTLLRESVPRGYGEFDESCFVFGATAFVVLAWQRLSPPRPPR